MRECNAIPIEMTTPPYFPALSEVCSPGLNTEKWAKLKVCRLQNKLVKKNKKQVHYAAKNTPLTLAQCTLKIKSAILGKLITYKSQSLISPC